MLNFGGLINMNLKYYVKIKLKCMLETREFEFGSLYQLTNFLKNESSQGRTFIIECR